MRTSFALATLLLALTAVAAPVADGEASLEKREPHGHHHHGGHGSGYSSSASTGASTHSSTSSSSSLSSGDSSGLDSDEQSVLDSHNKYRALHSAPPLTWSSDLASYALSHASGCVFDHTGGNRVIFGLD